MDNLKNVIKKYLSHILCIIIVLLLIIIGFLYSDNVTNKIEKTVKKEELKEEIKEEIKKIYVDIKGEVKHPGVYELNENERVIDVIKKADGLTDKADTSYINLSKKLKDEMIIIIYSKNEIKEYEKNKKENKVKEIIKYEIIEKEKECPNTTNDACIKIDNNEDNKISDKKSNKDTNISSEENNSNIEENKDTSELINLNTATKQELLTLPGIGESKADLILDYQNINKFNSIEDIKNVKGIGDSLFEKIKNYITV